MLLLLLLGLARSWRSIGTESLSPPAEASISVYRVEPLLLRCWQPQNSWSLPDCSLRPSTCSGFQLKTAGLQSAQFGLLIYISGISFQLCGSLNDPLLFLFGLFVCFCIVLFMEPNCVHHFYSPSADIFGSGTDLKYGALHLPLPPCVRGWLQAILRQQIDVWSVISVGRRRDQAHNKHTCLSQHALVKINIFMHGYIVLI